MNTARPDLPEPLGTITLNNITGGNITNIQCSGSGAFGGFDGCPSWSDIVPNGGEIKLAPLPGTSGRYSTSVIDFWYTDWSGFDKSAKITCTGNIQV